MFAKYSDKLHRAAETSNLMSFNKLGAVFGPALGGLIAVQFGFPTLFLVASLVMALSVMPLFFTRDTKPRFKFSLLEIFDKRHKKFLLGYIADDTRHMGENIFWPLFVFLVLGSTVVAGYAATTVSIGIIVFTLTVGRLADGRRRMAILRTGGMLGAMVWFLRIFVKTDGAVYILSFLSGMFSVLVNVPFVALTFDEAKRSNPLSFVIFREIGLGIGRVLLLLIALLITEVFAFSFFTAGISTLLLGLF